VALFLSTAVGSPVFGRERERERHGELNGGEEAMNPRAENGERR
jgi:hypothetical protein